MHVFIAGNGGTDSFAARWLRVSAFRPCEVNGSDKDKGLLMTLAMDGLEAQIDQFHKAATKDSLPLPNPLLPLVKTARSFRFFPSILKQKRDKGATDSPKCSTLKIVKK